MDAAAEIGRNPLSKHQIQHEYGDEQDHAGRDCRTRLARPNSQDWQPYPVDPYCYRLYVVTMQVSVEANKLISDTW